MKRGDILTIAQREIRVLDVVRLASGTVLASGESTEEKIADAHWYVLARHLDEAEPHIARMRPKFINGAATRFQEAYDLRDWIKADRARRCA